MGQCVIPNTVLKHMARARIQYGWQPSTIGNELNFDLFLLRYKHLLLITYKLLVLYYNYY